MKQDERRNKMKTCIKTKMEQGERNATKREGCDKIKTYNKTKMQ